MRATRPTIDLPPVAFSFFSLFFLNKKRPNLMSIATHYSLKKYLAAKACKLYLSKFEPDAKLHKDFYYSANKKNNGIYDCFETFYFAMFQNMF